MRKPNLASRRQDGAATFSATGRTGRIASRLRSAGTKPDAAGDRGRRALGDAPACRRSSIVAGVELPQAEERLGDLGRAGAELAVEGDDLAREDLERRRPRTHARIDASRSSTTGSAPSAHVRAGGRPRPRRSGRSSPRRAPAGRSPSSRPGPRPTRRAAPGPGRRSRAPRRADG